MLQHKIFYIRYNVKRSILFYHSCPNDSDFEYSQVPCLLFRVEFSRFSVVNTPPAVPGAGNCRGCCTRGSTSTALTHSLARQVVK